MKNKVDISKLIEKKYKGNTLDLSDILEQIDLVLNEAADYKSKISGQASDAAMEEMSMERYASAIVNGAGDPRNERPDSDQKKFIPADKIAENVATKAETVTLEIPDIFSLVTNSEMELAASGDADRILIDKIIKRMGVSGKRNWVTRLQSLQRFMQDTSGEIPTWDGNIRTGVANLIYLNVLKKISHSIAQPGKLFEYVIAPLISSTAYVEGATDQSIIDVTKTFKGKSYSYSIKLFTGESTDLKVEGSRNELAKKVLADKSPVTYIVAYVDKENNNISFSEMYVTTDITYFNGWNTIKSLTQGTTYKRQGAGNQPDAYGIWVNPSPTQKPTSDISTQSSGIPTQSKEPVPKQVSKKLPSQISFGGKEDWKTKDLLTFNNDLKANSSAGAIKLKRLIDKVPQYKEQFDAVQNNTDQLKALADTIYTDSQLAINRAAAESPTNESQIFLENEEDELALASGTFSIPLKGSWSELNTIKINLGKPENFRVAQLKMSGQLVKDMKTVFENYRQLNTNILNFFATTPDKEEDYGQKAIDNAERIKNGVEGFQRKEKAGIKESSTSEDKSTK